MSTRSTAKINSGSASRSSPGIYNTDPATMFSVKPSSSEKSASASSKTKPVSVKPVSVKPVSASSEKPVSANTPVNSSKTRLLTVPVAIMAEVSGTGADAGGSSFLRYMIIFIIIGFLCLTLFLYLEKPADKSLKNLYDPVLKYLGMNITNQDIQKAAVNKLAKALDEKKVVNKIDKDKEDDTDDYEENNKKEITSNSAAEEQASNLLKRKYKKKPVIPTPDEASTNSLHTNKPKSKAGFCYIGEDAGNRSCIKVEEGDVCMSGDIFPTQAICINPKLRE